MDMLMVIQRGPVFVAVTCQEGQIEGTVRNLERWWADAPVHPQIGQVSPEGYEISNNPELLGYKLVTPGEYLVFERAWDRVRLVVDYPDRDSFERAWKSTGPADHSA